jgi:hypothetical protein
MSKPNNRFVKELVGKLMAHAPRTVPRNDDFPKALAGELTKPLTSCNVRVVVTWRHNGGTCLIALQTERFSTWSGSERDSDIKARYGATLATAPGAEAAEDGK